MPKPRIVVADDQVLMLDTVRRILEHDFDVVATAACGRDALSAIRQHDPDVVVLDVLMPDLDGFQVVAEARALGLTARVVMISGMIDDDYVLKALRTGADGYVAKP